MRSGRAGQDERDRARSLLCGRLNERPARHVVSSHFVATGALMEHTPSKSLYLGRPAVGRGRWVASAVLS